MENYSGDAEFQKFLEATNFIQQYTGVFLRRNDARSPKILEHLSNITQLIELVKQLLAEEREMNAKRELMNSRQRNMNSIIKEKFQNPPSTTSTTTNQNLRQQLDLQQQNFDLEQILGRIQSNFGSGNNYQSHTPTQTSNFGVQENGNFSNLLDANPFFDSGGSPSSSSSPQARQIQKNGGVSSKSSKSAAPRVISLLPAGPYQCRNCDKSFRQKHGLTQHSLTHESNGAFECDGCGKRYSRQESVYRHQRSTQCCAKYHSLTNVRHHEGSSSDSKNNQIIPPGFLM